ncbi:MAG: AraC family transcriptional regulator [Hyphomicrobiaceae bacterium]
MTKNQTKADYAQRITRVVDYIYENLDGDLSADKLAEIANFSTHHWHRIFHAMTGSTVAETVRRLRLHRAASDLLNHNLSIAQAAKRAGYTSIEAFTRAFRAAYGEPPGAFRKKRLTPYAIDFPEPKGSSMPDVAIKTMDAVELISLPHRGAYNNIGRTFEKLAVQAGSAGLLGPASQMYGIYYDDPDVVAEAELRSAAAFKANGAALPAGSGFETVTLDGGRHAVMIHEGAYSDLAKSYQWLFGVWLPESGEEAADRPCFEAYLNDPKTTAPPDLRTAIHLPLK